MARRQIRVCFVGDSLTAGVGDKRWMSWPLRVCAEERERGYELTPYNLGVRGDTSADIRSRWHPECQRRLAEPWPGGIVFAFGVNDTCDRGGDRRVPFHESVDCAKAMVTQARNWQPTFWIGPAPVARYPEPLQITTGGVEHRFWNQRIAALSAAFQAIRHALCGGGRLYLAARHRSRANRRGVHALSRHGGKHSAAAQTVSFSLTIDRVPQAIAEAILATTASTGLGTFLVLSIVLLIVMGAALEGAPALIIFGPILLPIAVGLGVDPVQYGLVLIVAMGIGLFAPPLGIGIYISCAVGGVRVEDTARPIAKYLLVLSCACWCSPSCLQ